MEVPYQEEQPVTVLKIPRQRPMTMRRLTIGRVPCVVNALIAACNKLFPLFSQQYILPVNTMHNRRGGRRMYEPTQELIVAELRLRSMAQVADIMRILEPSCFALLPYELQRMKETGLVVYDEPLGLESVVRLP